jgi:hypothetical protein
MYIIYPWIPIIIWHKHGLFIFLSDFGEPRNRRNIKFYKTPTDHNSCRHLTQYIMYIIYILIPIIIWHKHGLFIFLSDFGKPHNRRNLKINKTLPPHDSCPYLTLLNMHIIYVLIPVIIWHKNGLIYDFESFR